MLRLIVFVFILACFASCEKVDTSGAIIGETEVEIVIYNPKEESTIDGKEVLSIDGRIDANAQMSAYTILIQNAATDSILEEFTDRYTTSQFIVHHHWTPSLTQPSELLLTVEALDQNDGILASKTILIYCQ